MHNFPFWSKNILRAAGIYNIIWGSWVVLFPYSFFNLFELPLPTYPMIWQSVGMIVGVYGIGYYIAAYNPQQHWPIILVGWLGKLFGPIGALYYLLTGKLTPWFLLHNLTNDIIWLPFFTIIIYHIFKNAQVNGSVSIQPFLLTLKEHTTNNNRTISDLNQTAPVLLIFLRHFGCTFCRETIADLRKNYDIISKNCKVVIIHMSDKSIADHYFHKYGLSNIEHLSDPNRLLYQSFELPRGTFSQLFGIRNWWRGFVAGILKGHGIGKLQGDGFQMPGVFLLHHNKIIESYYYKNASDQPDFVQISKKAKKLVPLN